MRRRLPWLVALPLMAVGSFAAHGLSAVVSSARAHEPGGPESGADELVLRSSSGLAAHAVLGVALVAALVAVAAICRLARRRGRGAPPWAFLILPPLTFSLQELFERVLRAEAAPFQAALEPRFLIGLALQLPFGLTALVAARLLLRAGRRIVRTLTRPAFVPVLRRSVVLRSPSSCVLPRIPALALGYPERGPPVL